MSALPRTNWEERIDLSAPVEEICKRLGIDRSYVAEIRLEPDKATVTIFRGKDGRFEGAKHIWPDSGNVVMETETYEIRT